MSPYYTNLLITGIVSEERAGEKSASEEVAGKEIASIRCGEDKASKVTYILIIS